MYRILTTGGTPEFFVVTSVSMWVVYGGFYGEQHEAHITILVRQIALLYICTYIFRIRTTSLVGTLKDRFQARKKARASAGSQPDNLN